MLARNPRLTFEQALPHWAADRAFSQITNAGSLSIPAVEIFLNKVMARARTEISDPKIRHDIDIFIAQEGNHYRQHRLFNKVMYSRYPRLREFDDELSAYYENMLNHRSLQECAAYCEGFESLGLIQVEFFFEQIDDLLAGADPRLVRLWKWHLAEEFEHRSVCYEVHYALCSGYPERVRGFIRAMRHLGAHGKQVSRYLLEEDAGGLTETEKADLVAAEKSYRRRLWRFALPRVLAILSPGYDPRKKQAPRGVAELLGELDPLPA